MLIPKKYVEGRSKFLDPKEDRVGLLYYSNAFSQISLLEGLEKRSFEKLLQISQRKLCEEISNQFGYETINLDSNLDFSNYDYEYYFSPAEILVIIRDQVEIILKAILNAIWEDECQIYVFPISDPAVINITFKFSTLENSKKFFNSII